MRRPPACGIVRSGCGGSDARLRRPTPKPPSYSASWLCVTGRRGTESRGSVAVTGRRGFAGRAAGLASVARVHRRCGRPQRRATPDQTGLVTPGIITV